MKFQKLVLTLTILTIGMACTPAALAGGTKASHPHKTSKTCVKGHKKVPCPPPLDLQPFVDIPGYPVIPRLATVSWPMTGAYDLKQYKYLGGYFGLGPLSPTIRLGNVDIFWYADKAATQIVGVQGFPLSDRIVSNALLHFTNQGRYIKIVFQCTKESQGDCPFGMRLFGTNRPGDLPLFAPDTTLITQAPMTLPARGTVTIYPDDYWAGWVRYLLDAPPGFRVTAYNADLTDIFYPVDYFDSSVGPTVRDMIAPMGAWMVVVSNNTDSPGTFSLTATPDVTQKVVVVPTPVPPRSN